MYLRSLAKGVLFSVLTSIFGDGDGFAKLPTLTGPGRGLRFKLDLLKRGESSYLFGTYERNVIQQVLKLCQPGSTVWDCGTYLGFYTNIMARAVGPRGHVVAVEPNPNNLLRTKENLQINRLKNVDFVEAAIAGSSGEMEFAFCDNTNSHLPGTYVGSSHSDYVNGRFGKYQHDPLIGSVRGITLDDLYVSGEALPPDLIKLDIEGAELHALAGCRKLVMEQKPIIILELHNPECDAAAWRFARDCDYELIRLPTMERIGSAGQVYGTLLCRPRSLDG